MTSPDTRARSGRDSRPVGGRDVLFESCNLVNSPSPLGNGSYDRLLIYFLKGHPVVLLDPRAARYQYHGRIGKVGARDTGKGVCKAGTRGNKTHAGSFPEPPVSVRRHRGPLLVVRVDKPYAKIGAGPVNGVYVPTSECENVPHSEVIKGF